MPEPLLVDFFFDLAEGSFAEPGAGLGEAAPAPSEILIAGIPIRLGNHEGPADAGWRTIAGARANYTSRIADNLAMTSTVRVARTDFVTEGAPGKAVASAATVLQYASDGWTFALQPGLEIARWETELMQRDSYVEGRISRALGNGLSVVSTGRYRWHGTTGGQAADSEIAFGRFGLVCRLPHQVRIDLAYVVRQQDSSDLIRGAGPSVAIALPLIEAVDLSANYDLTRTARYDAADSRLNGRTRNLHRLGAGMIWHVGGRASDILLSTAYRYEHAGAEGGGQDEARHAGTVSFALDF